MEVKEDMNVSGAAIAASPTDVGVRKGQKKPDIIKRTDFYKKLLSVYKEKES